MIKKIIIRHKFWILVSLIYFTLLYSTSLHHFYGVERTVSLSHFVETDETLKKYFPDMGILKGQPIYTYWRYVWKLTSFSLDAGYYITESEKIQHGVAPYKYRILPVLIAHLISSTLQISREMSFVLMNILLIYLTALLFNYYLLKYFNFTKTISFLGGILFITIPTVTGTVSFPMLDPISLFFSMLIFLSVIRKNPYLFIMSSITGVLSKEILIISSLMWFIETVQLNSIKKLLINILISAIPIIIFVSTRMLLGGSPFEIEFGHNPLHGDFPILWKRLISFGGWIYIILSAFLSFTFLWTGIVNVNKNAFIKRQIIIVPIVILAASMFSAQIIRPLGILFPIVIPMFLMFFKNVQKQPSKLL